MAQRYIMYRDRLRSAAQQHGDMEGEDLMGLSGLQGAIGGMEEFQEDDGREDSLAFDPLVTMTAPAITTTTAPTSTLASRFTNAPTSPVTVRFPSPPYSMSVYPLAYSAPGMGRSRIGFSSFQQDPTDSVRRSMKGEEEGEVFEEKK